jgi:hypothetical protein
MACVASCMPLSTRGIYREVVSGAFDENDSRGLGYPNPDHIDLNTALVVNKSTSSEDCLSHSSNVFSRGVDFS